MKKNIVKILSFLNRRTVYCRFNILTSASDQVVVFETEYFGRNIKIIAIQNMKGVYEYLILIENWLPVQDPMATRILIDATEATFTSLDTVINCLNQFVKKYPFTIVKHARGEYQVLDPNGFDYIGEYVTKIDAIQTCHHNYIFQG